MKKTTFEEYLETTCFEANPSVLDDDIPDFFNFWLGNQEVEDMIRHCNNFLSTSITQAIVEERKRVMDKLIGDSIHYGHTGNCTELCKQIKVDLLSSLDKEIINLNKE